MQRLKRIVACVGIAGMVVSASVPAYAGENIAIVQGTALVNTGAGYVASESNTALKPGDRIMVRPGTTAAISYGNNCTIPLKSGQLVTIGSKSPCDVKAQFFGEGDSNGGLIIAGGLGLGLVGIGIWAATRDGNGDKEVFVTPVSP